MIAPILAGLLALAPTPKASGWFQAYEVPLPPERMRGSAVAGAVFFTDQGMIDLLCGGHDYVVACTDTVSGVMILPNPCQPRFAGESYAALACHEKGHVLGWTAWHEEGKPK